MPFWIVCCKPPHPLLNVQRGTKSHVNGILLYGPPGCGKSLLLQVICSSIRKPCLVVTPSVLLQKYVGETNQRIRALFSLASKLGGDCLLILDEIDGLFRERRHDENDVSREAKTEFLQWWDGIQSSNVFVVAATNRPFDVDPAVLRRLPQSHFIGLPDDVARQGILHQVLSTIPTDPDLSISELVSTTEGYSPSDLVQLVRTAVLQGPMRESYATKPKRYRPLTTHDLLQAKQHIGATPLSYTYTNSMVDFHKQRHPHEQLAPNQTPPDNASFHDLGTFHVEASHFFFNDDEDDEGNHNDSDDDDDWDLD